MLYENTLLKTFDNGYDEAVLIKQEKLRKNIATMIYCFYTNNKASINNYLKEYMLDSGIHDARAWDGLAQRLVTVPDGSNQIGMFTQKTANIMPKIHYDIVGKVLDLVCTVYNAGADRYLSDESGNVNEEATKYLMGIYESLILKIMDIYKQGYLFNTILVQPVVRNDKIELDIITPNFCSVTTHDNDYTKLKSVMIAKSIDNEDAIVYWSDTEHYYVNYKDERKPIKEFEGYDKNGKEIYKTNGMKNPLKELPFAVLRFQCSSDFWGEPQQDLIENNIWYDIRESNQFFVEMFQGLGVGVGVNLTKEGTTSISPNTIIHANNVIEGQIPPSLTFASTGAPLTELRESNDSMYKRIGNSKGLSSASMTNEVTEQSGISKAYDSAELQIKKDSHKTILKQFENDLFLKIRLVNNYYAMKRIDEKLVFHLDIIEDEPMINVSDEIQITEFKLKNNLISIFYLAVKDNPYIKDEMEIKTKLEDNKKINQQYLNQNDNESSQEKKGTPGSSAGAGDNTGNPA